MRKLFTSIMAASLLAAPVQASGWRDQTVDVRSGAFIGARFKLSIGGKTAAKPQAALAIAPTQSRISSEGMIRTRIGEGIALNLVAAKKPTLTLAGVRADSALGLRRDKDIDAKQKHGISTTGWVAIGVGAVLVAGAIGFALWVDEVEDSGD